MLEIVPLELAEANTLVARWHRHHAPTVGHRFSVGVQSAGTVVGAAIVGRPIARHFDDGWTLEVYRCVTDGTRNACSALYGACRRAAFALGYRRLVTYTLRSERGASLRGAGWRDLGLRGYDGKAWNCKTRPRVVTGPREQKRLWEAVS